MFIYAPIWTGFSVLISVQNFLAIPVNVNKYFYHLKYCHDKIKHELIF